MNNYNYFIKKHDLKVEKLTKTKNTTIIKTPLGQFVFKKGNINIYNYLLSRGFNYFPKIVDYNDNLIMFKYIENIEYDKEQKAEDYIKLISLLHSKTCYYKQVDIDNYKDLYEKLYSKLDDINNYYSNLINIIETKEYMSPCEYLIARNITNIFLLINNSYRLLEDWYKIIKNNDKKRVVTLYNSIDINNMIKGTKGIYLTSFNNTSVDIPIYDLYNFYNKYYLDFDFRNIIKRYEELFPLIEDEVILLMIMISIPEKVIINNTVNNIIDIKIFINKIFRTIDFLNSKKEEDTSAHQEKNDK